MSTTQKSLTEATRLAITYIKLSKENLDLAHKEAAANGPNDRSAYYLVRAQIYAQLAQASAALA